MEFMRRKIPHQAELLSLVLALLLVLLIAALSYRAWAAFGGYSEQLANTQQTVDGVNSLLSTLRDAETGQRGYVITGEDRYLEPYQRAVAELPTNMAALSRAADANPDQAEAVTALRPLVEEKMEELLQTIDLRRDQGEDAARTVVVIDRGKFLMDQIRGKCADIQRVAYSRQAQEAADVRASADQLGWVGTLGSGILFGLLLLSTLAIRRGTRRRQELIHDLLESEERAREARDWLQTIIGSIGDGVIVTDAEGKVTMVNGVAQSLTGWKQHEAQGLPLKEILPITNEESGATVENPVTRVLREGRIVGLANHTQLETRDGKQIPIDDSAAPVRDKAGTITGVVLVFRDISERVRHAKLLERTNLELQHFAYAASHDLREPLRTITIYAEMLQRDGAQLDERSSEYLRVILAGSHRMSQLVDSLLDYAKAGEVAAESFAPIEMEEVLAAVMGNLRGTIDSTQAVITHDPLPVISGDQMQFERLLQNLIGNALKYGRDEPPRIHVSARQQASEWIFSVADNGQGIAPEHQTQIFELFRRLHGQDESGSGIGLATCKKIVERFGGRIWVESEVGKGSCFIFTLPATPRATTGGAV
jgi:PAS domain S-box-containing protein